ncbi:hypothetical protein, partial [Phenylobacterium sp.]|uniref:hypothetical protein n=1 Tax=Phenylobacterium sp. TaxID=1871053 RepID=UPI002EDB7742
AAALAVAATGAYAQPVLQQLEDLRMQQEAANRRAIDQSNQLMALEARLRADQASADLQRSAPRVPELRYEPSTRRGTAAAAARFPSIPDAALADSNRRVQDAARNRR